MIAFMSIVATASILLRTATAARMPDQDLGIGFDFTPAYGTSAISYANGSNIALSKIEGAQAWTQLMFDLSLRKDRWEDFPTETVPVFTNMLRSLRSASEGALGFPVQNATITLPANHMTEGYYWHPGLLKFVREAFDAADMRFVQIISHAYAGEPISYPEMAVLAGHGALCEPYSTSWRTCWEAGRYPPMETYYLVGYYTNALEVTMARNVTVAYGTSPIFDLSFELGSDMRYRNPDERFYWEEVRRFLSISLADHARPKPTKVVLYGEQSGDKDFRRMVSDVLENFLEKVALPDWIEDGLDPTFAGAIGAAEFVKRAPYWNKGRPFMEDGLTVQTP